MDDSPAAEPQPDEVARHIYESLRETRQLNRRRTIAYRCSANCLLLDVVRIPQHGLLVHHPRYRLSAGKNERDSTPAGRANHTTDGANHWNEQTYFAGPAYEHFTVRCRHMLDFDLARSRVDADIAAGRTGVELRRSGEPPSTAQR